MSIGDVVSDIGDAIVEAFTPDGMRHHRVKFPENLSTLSKKYYGTCGHAMDIYQANRAVLTDPDSVTPGMILLIPHIPHPRKF